MNALGPEKSVLQMLDGEVAIISSSHHHVGDIVQRYGDNLVTFGKKKGDSYTGLFNCATTRMNVREIKFNPGEVALQLLSKVSELEKQSEYRTKQFAELERLEKLINDSCAGFSFAGIPVEDLSRKTLNILMKVAILAKANRLNDLHGGRIGTIDMELVK